MFKQAISIEETIIDKSLETTKPNPMLPRGSALITSSGNLVKQHMNAIIHAATGSMRKSGGIFDPTKLSIANSIKNAFILLNLNGFSKLAIPFIGGKIFLSRIGITADELAKIIIDASFEANLDGSKFVIIIHGIHDYNIFKKVIQDNYPKIDHTLVLKEGSILDYSLHGCDTIMNAANMEVEFGGGLSGIIARATGDALAIDKEAITDIKKFWENQK